MPRSRKLVVDQAANLNGPELHKEVEKALLDFAVTLDVAEKQLSHLRALREFTNVTLAGHENRMHAIIQQAPSNLMGQAMPSTIGRR